MSNTSYECRMPAISHSAMQDETRAMIRARIECLLTSGAVATQVKSRLRTRGCRSPWAEVPAEAERLCADPDARPAVRASEGREGWRSSSSRRGSI